MLKEKDRHALLAALNLMILFLLGGILFEFTVTTMYWGEVFIVLVTAFFMLVTDIFRMFEQEKQEVK